MEKKTSRKKSDLASLENTLSEVYSNKKWNNQWRLFRLSKDWPIIVGKEVAQLTTPAFFRKDVLWIFVQDSAWMQHMQYIKLDLLERINRVLTEQAITDIRWQLQPVTLPPPERFLPEPHAVDPEQERSFRSMTEGVSNPECREALQRLWHIFASYSDE
jgi:hypothetical protein